jgi:hypothetical protein
VALVELWFALLLVAPPLQADSEVFLCPLHRDELGNRDDRCPICGRAFESRILRSIGSCPMHGQVRGVPGELCAVCRMALVPVTMEVLWVCPRHPEKVLSLPGKCAEDGAPLEEKINPMPHGDHNPRHGGILFMAPDGFHHLEGVLTPAGSFRLYLYDNFTRPVDARAVRARIDDRLLQPAGEGEFLELALPAAERYPVEVVLHARFGPAGSSSAEERFDFVFAGETPAAGSIPAAGPLVIPAAASEIVSEILIRAERIEDMMRRGVWNELYIPALEAKSLALALEKKAGQDVSLPVKRIVRAAWLLDIYGDLGNRLKVESAYEIFRLGVRELKAQRDAKQVAR